MKIGWEKHWVMGLLKGMKQTMRNVWCFLSWIVYWKFLSLISDPVIVAYSYNDSSDGKNYDVED